MSQEPLELETPPDEPTIRIQNEALRRGFTLMPNSVLRARGISRDAKMLYSILLSYAWQKDSCFPGYDLLQEDLQCGRAQVSRYLKELRTAGLIETMRRGFGKTNLYLIKDVPAGLLPPENGQQSQIGTSRSSKSELVVVPNQNRKNTQYEEDSVEENARGHTRTLLSKTGGVPRGGKKVRRAQQEEDSGYLDMCIAEWSQLEWNDADHIASNQSQARNLWERSGLEVEDFVQRYVYPARGRLREQRGVENRAAYFFTVLREMVDTPTVTKSVE